MTHLSLAHSEPQPHAENPQARLEEILAARRLKALFQPIVEMRSPGVVGFEGLIRGPSDSPLHSPLMFFQAARDLGRYVEAEYLSRATVLNRFAELGVPGKIFLNVSPDILLMEGWRSGETLRCIRESGLDPSRIVIELTENSPTRLDYRVLREATQHYRAMGFQIAMDDLGEGFSSLRMWSEIRPDYVKIDKHFIQNINLDPVKLQFVRSIQEIARNAGCRVIAEGIETHAELVTIRDLGVDFGQGYFFAHPQPIPETRLAPGILGTLGGLRPSGSPGNALLRQRHATVANLVKYVVPVSPETTNDVVFDMIEQDPQLNTIPVVNDSGIPIGLISRYAMIDRFARRYGKELFGKRACATLMEPTPLIVERNVSLHEISNRILAMEAYHLTLGFIVTASGKYIGIGSGHDLLREITQMQIAAARYANPLTQLPGNVPINEHIDHLLQQGQPFCACYFDLDHFKAYNDVYGFRSGDEMIKLVSRLLQEITDPEADFIGHIGGDDFLVLFRSPDWEMRCQMLLRKFAVASQTLYEAADIARGGIECEDRQGRRVLHPLASLSVGAVRVDDHYRTHHEVSAAVSFAKKQAKKVPGNALFIERRASQAGQETKIEACCAA